MSRVPWTPRARRIGRALSAAGQVVVLCLAIVSLPVAAAFGAVIR